MKDFTKHPYFVLLDSLDLPRTDFAIAGSGPLFARGWISEIGDVDVVARGEAWKRVRKLGDVVDAPLSTSHLVRLFDGEIEVLDAWFPEIWNADTLIDEADIICGFRFVRLDVVFESKRLLQRPRDKMHLDVMADHGLRMGERGQER
jgi:hypothetical protein